MFKSPLSHSESLEYFLPNSISSLILNFVIYEILNQQINLMYSLVLSCYSVKLGLLILE